MNRSRCFLKLLEIAGGGKRLARRGLLGGGRVQFGSSLLQQLVVVCGMERFSGGRQFRRGSKFLGTSVREWNSEGVHEAQGQNERSECFHAVILALNDGDASGRLLLESLVRCDVATYEHVRQRSLVQS